jgi:ATP-dependent 26S proteasome regulatory subunit
VRFDSVGGLSKQIQALKEMVVFPLLYPEVFEKFKIQPPRFGSAHTTRATSTAIDYTH